METPSSGQATAPAEGKFHRDAAARAEKRRGWCAAAF
jgi:hypothetical protein